MLGTLPTHAKRNWQERVATLTHTYNFIISPVTGCSPNFLMFERTLKLPLDIELGSINGGTKTNIPLSHRGGFEQTITSVMFMHWAYLQAQENNKN